MKARLEELALQIEQEILETGTVVVNGIGIRKNNSGDNPYAGLCQNAVGKLKELAPDLEMKYITFQINNNKNQMVKDVHAVAEVVTDKGNFVVDPTIKQYLPEAKMVYAAGEEYPLIGVKGTMRELVLQNYQ